VIRTPAIATPGPTTAERIFQSILKKSLAKGLTDAAARRRAANIAKQVSQTSPIPLAPSP